MKKKALFSSILAIVLCLSLITGATFALFTSEAKINVAVTSANVEVTAAIDQTTLKVYSMDVEQANQTFENGGTANFDANGDLELALVTPGDKVEFTIDVENKSNVAIQYMVVPNFEGPLADYLEVSAVAVDGGAIATEWTPVAANGTIGDILVTVELPAEVGNEAKNKTDVTNISFTVKAVQGNGTIDARVRTAEDLAAAIADATEPTRITIVGHIDNANNQISIPSGKDITIISGEYTGQFKVSGKLTLNGVILNDPTAVVAGEVSQYSKSAIALVNSGDVIVKNSTINLGNLADSTAITAWWSTGNGANIEVYNTVFNCAGQRPIRSDACVTVEGCTFNDPYRYAIQMTSKSSTMAADAEAYVNFNNNTIVAGTTSTKPVYGVQLEGGYGCSDLTINGEGNTIDVGTTGKDAVMYYCECGAVDHDSLVWNTEVAPVHENYTLKTVTSTADALDALANGDWVTLAAGDYGTLTLDGNTPLRNVTIEADADANVEIVIAADANLKDVTLKGFEPEYNYDAGSYRGVLQIAAGATVDNLTIEDCVFAGTGSRAAGISCASTTATITVKNCTFKGTKYAWYNSAATAKEMTFEGCTFEGNTSWAIQANGTAVEKTKVVINGCTFTNCTGGIFKYLDSTNVDTFTFTNNILTGCAGHDASDAKWFEVNDAAITNLTVSGNTLDGADWVPGVANGLSK